MGRGQNLAITSSSSRRREEISFIDHLDNEGDWAHELVLEYGLNTVEDISSAFQLFKEPAHLAGFRVAVLEEAEEWQKPFLLQFAIDDFNEKQVSAIWRRDLDWLENNNYLDNFSKREMQSFKQDNYLGNYTAALLRGMEIAKEGGIASRELNNALINSRKQLEEGKKVMLDVYPFELLLAENYEGENETLFQEVCKQADKAFTREGIEHGQPTRMLTKSSFLALARNLSLPDSPKKGKLYLGRYTLASNSILVIDEEWVMKGQTVYHETLHAAQNNSSPGEKQIYANDGTENRIFEVVTNLYAAKLMGSTTGMDVLEFKEANALIALLKEKPGISLKEVAPLHPNKMIERIGKHLFPGKRNWRKKLAASFKAAEQKASIQKPNLSSFN